MPTVNSGISFGSGITLDYGLVQDSLALDLDATNPRSTCGQRSLINWSTWIAGTTGSATGYSQNGDGNSRINDTIPFGYTSVVWDVSNQDVTSDADGGWNTSLFNIDPTQMYRWTTWVRRKTIGNGSFYLGLYGYNSANSNVGVLNRSNGAVNTNPYFSATGWWGSANDWYLVVGHTWPAGSGTGAAHPDSGIYNTSGIKVASCSDYVWQATNAKSVHRTYLYYSTNVSTNQQWFQPRVDLIDGTQPGIGDLLSNAGSTWYDVSGQANNAIMYSLPSFALSPGYFTFDGTANYGTVVNNSRLNFSSSQSLQIVMRHTYTSGRKNPWNQAYGGYGTWTHEAGAYINQYYGNSGTNGSPYVGQPSPATPSSVWNIICAVRSTAEFKWYINGTLASTSANPYGVLTATSANITIGNGYAGFWQGDMSRVTAYTKALSDTEVAQNFTAICGIYGL